MRFENDKKFIINPTNTELLTCNCGFCEKCARANNFASIYKKETSHVNMLKEVHEKSLDSHSR